MSPRAGASVRSEQSGNGIVYLGGVAVTWINVLMVAALVGLVTGVWELLLALWRRY